MKKALLIIYLLISLGFMLTAVSWLTWNSSCPPVVVEGSTGKGLCGGDGVQFVGIFVFSIVIAAVYWALTALVLKLLGFKISKR